RDSLPDHGKRKINAFEPQKEEMDLIALGFQSPKKRQVASARKRSLEGKGNATPGKRLDFPKHRSTGSQGSGLGRKGRHPLCNQVSIHKVCTVRVFRKKFAGKGRLACPVRSRNDVEFHEALYPNESPALRRVSRQMAPQNWEKSLPLGSAVLGKVRNSPISIRM